jgi:hypothetical protein
VGAEGVVLVPPSLDDDLGFLEGVEDFAIEKFVPEQKAKRLRNVGLNPLSCQP